MNILFISQYFHPENFANNKIVEDLVSRGHKVTVICAIPNYPGGKFFEGYGYFKNRRGNYKGAQILRAPVVPRGNNPVQLIANYASFVVTAGWQCLFFKRGQFDIVFCSAPSPATIAIPGIIAAWRMKVPVVLWLLDLWPHTVFDLLKLKNRWLRAPVNALCRWIYNNLDCIMVSSRAFVDKLAGYAPHDMDYYYLPNTIEEMHKPLKPDNALRKNTGIAKGQFVFMVTGNIGTAQNVDVLIDAANRLQGKPFIFVLLGEGRDRKRLSQRIEQLGLANHFLFLGIVPANEIANHLSYAHAAVITLADEPVFLPTVPYRLQTYLGCGKMILASIGGESARIIKQADCGYVSKPNEANALAHNMMAMMAMTGAQKNNFEKQARNYALENYQRDNVMDGLENLLIAKSNVLTR